MESSTPEENGFVVKEYTTTIDDSIFKTSDRTDFKPFKFNKLGKNITEKYYFRNGTDKNSKFIIVDIPGGGFVSVANHLEEYDWLKEFDIYSLSYPLLFNNTAADALVYLLNLIRYIYETKDPNKKICFIGTSSGAYYVTRIINILQNELSDLSYDISCAILINGYYNWRRTNSIVLKSLDLIYMDKYSSKYTQSKYNVMPINQDSMDLMIITSTDDKLMESSSTFAAQNQIPVTKYAGDHHFFWSRTGDYELARSDVYKFIVAGS